MKIPLFASLIVFCIWLAYELNKYNQKEKTAIIDFWANESRANSVRRKPLNNLDYITIPFDALPFDLLPDHPIISQCHKDFESLRDKKIVNLTGFTNTELKLQYGAPNLTLLSEYDENYTLFSSSLYKWGEALYKEGYEKEAVDLLEFGISTKTDISGNYRLLYNHYVKTDNQDKINKLRESAESLNCVMKNPIIRTLWGADQTSQEADLYND